METLKTAKFYQNIAQIVLIPSNSLLHSYKQSLKSLGIDLKTAPVIMDCYCPIYCETDIGKILIFGPFIGFTSAAYLINLLYKYDLKSVYFSGTASLFSNVDTTQDLYYPSNFLQYNSIEDQNLNSEKITNISIDNLWATKTEIFEAISIPYPTFMMPKLIGSLEHNDNIKLIDMESAYIAGICLKLGINFYCSLSISDITTFDNDKSTSLKKPKSTHNYSNLVEKLNNIIKK